MKSKISVVFLGASLCLIAAAVFVNSSSPATGKDEDSGAEYTGSKVCRTCHRDEYTVWKSTKHGKAISSLKPNHIATGKDDEGRACVQCHTTGYGQGGFASEAATPKLVNVGCESCHGPGSKHVADQVMTTTEEAEIHISKSVDCTQCHNPHISHKKLYGDE